MKRLIAAMMLAGLAAPALAQAPPEDVRKAVDAEVRAFMTSYWQAFNKGDAAALAKGFYASPDATEAQVSAALLKNYETLRADEWGKMNLFGFKTCVEGPGLAEVIMDYEYQFTYGGAMPPGDRATKYVVKKTGEGWRISSSTDVAPGEKLECDA